MGAEERMLVIGASGFLGSHLREIAAHSGLVVFGADRSGERGPRCDLLEPASITACLREVRPQLVVNMAGAPSVAASWEQPQRVHDLNAGGVKSLLRAVAEEAPSAHVLCVSSAEVYGLGAPGELPFGEEQTLAPLTPYGESKAAMEAHCETFARDFGLRIAVLRSFNQLGPGQSPNFVASGFARQIASAELAGSERVELAVGNLDAARDFTDVRDGARAFLAASRARLAGTFNLCSGHAMSIARVIEVMAEEAAVPLEIAPDPSLSRPLDQPLIYGDPRRLRAAIGWRPQIAFSQTISDLLGWWREKLAAS